MIRTNFYNITAHDNLIIVESFGTWDKTVAKGCLDNILKIVSQNFIDKSYAILEDTRKWELNTPDAMIFWKETFAKKCPHFPSHVVYVTDGSELKYWAIERMITDSMPFKAHIINGIHGGLALLESYGYNPPDL